MPNSPLRALIPAMRRRLVRAILFEPERSWRLSPLARHCRAFPSQVHRELALLVSARIVNRRQDGGQPVYSANIASPIFPDLLALFAKAEPMRDGSRPYLPALGRLFQNTQPSPRRICYHPDAIALAEALGEPENLDYYDQVLRKARRE